MNCHLVPQVYLKSWKIPDFENSIYTFENTNDQGKQKNINKLKNTAFAMKNKYLLNIYNTDYCFQLYDEFDLIFNELKDYFISNKNKRISSTTEFILSIPVLT